MKYLLPSLLLVSLLFSCRTKKDTTSDDNNNTDTCEPMGTVKDFTGLDGCKLLIVMDNGDKLLPNKINDESFTLAENQRISFSYTEIEDAISVCMTENAIVEVTCIKLIEQLPIKKECIKTDNINEATWMKAAIEKHDALKVERYEYLDDGWAYFFKNIKHGYLYDCQGNFLCEVEKNQLNQCKSPVKNPTAGVVIWESTDR